MKFSTGRGCTLSKWATGSLTDAECAMREYLLRGGFFMCDDFHGPGEWNVFM